MNEDTFEEKGFEEAEKLHGKLVKVINEWLKSPDVVEMEGAMIASALVFTLNQLIIESVEKSTPSRKSSVFILEGVVKYFQRRIEGLKNGD